MKCLIDDRHNQVEEANLSGTNSYLELEMPVDEESSMFLYFIPRNDSSMFITTCWEHSFDDLIDDLDEDDWETICDTWPTSSQLLVNGMKDRYREGALIKLEDPDDGENKWFVASISGNHDFEDIDDVFDERTQKTARVVVERSMELFTELQEKEPSMLRAFGRGILKGLEILALDTLFR